MIYHFELIIIYNIYHSTYNYIRLSTRVKTSESAPFQNEASFLF